MYAKLDGDLAGAMMSINAAKGVEIGDGFAAARLRARRMPTRCGPVRPSCPITPGNPRWISSGQPVVVRVAFKPASSILTPLQTIDRDGNETEIATRGRHDPCVGIRAVPVVEAMMALVLADHRLLHRAQCG